MIDLERQQEQSIELIEPGAEVHRLQAGPVARRWPFASPPSSRSFNRRFSSEMNASMSPPSWAGFSRIDAKRFASSRWRFARVVSGSVRKVM